MKIGISVLFLLCFLLIFLQCCEKRTGENSETCSIVMADTMHNDTVPLPITAQWVLSNCNHPSKLDSFVGLERPNFVGWKNMLAENTLGNDTLDLFFSVLNSYRNRKSTMQFKSHPQVEREEMTLFLGQFFLNQRSVLVNGDSIVKYEMVAEKEYVLRWGRRNSLDIQTTTERFRVLGNGFLGFAWESANAIVLRQGCGTECIKYVVLPKTPGMKESVMFNPTKFDLDRWR